MLLALLASVLALATGQQLPAFPTDTPGTFFSGTITDLTVLQRAPEVAKVDTVTIIDSCT